MMTKFVRVFLKNCFADFFLLALDVSSQLLSVTENDVKIRPISINFEFILFIMNLLNSRYSYSILVLKSLYTSLWHCTINYKARAQWHNLHDSDLSATPEHSGIPHILFDYHAESGARRLEKLEAKVSLSHNSIIDFE